MGVKIKIVAAILSFFLISFGTAFFSNSNFMEVSFDPDSLTFEQSQVEGEIRRERGVATRYECVVRCLGNSHTVWLYRGILSYETPYGINSVTGLPSLTREDRRKIAEARQVSSPEWMFWRTQEISVGEYNLLQSQVTLVPGLTIWLWFFAALFVKERSSFVWYMVGVLYFVHIILLGIIEVSLLLAILFGIPGVLIFFATRYAIDFFQKKEVAA